MIPDRRSVLAALGAALPFGLKLRPAAAAAPVGPPPELHFRPFEDAVREAFASGGVCRRVEVGHSEVVASGLQGCYNDRPFAGFPTGALRIVSTGSAPGPVFRGVRLYVATVDVELAGGVARVATGRPLDFATLPPAPMLSAGQPNPVSPHRPHPDRM